MNRFKLSVSAALMLVAVISCTAPKTNETHRAFYYWKTTFDLSPSELHLIDTLNITKLYLRFFDVDNENAGRIEPVGIVQFLSAPPPKTEIVPVVFIRNRVFEDITPEKVSQLVEKVYSKIYTIMPRASKKIKEIQIDCDWAVSTKKPYFFFLQSLKNRIAPVKISATIRLHQVKYYDRTGVPPVDRGMLMFYNMGDLNSPVSNNSIYDEASADKYVSSIKGYNLPLDVALPIFSWIVQQRNDKVVSLLTNINVQDIQQNKRFLTGGNGEYTADSSFFFHGNYMMKGDQFRLEEINPDICLQAARKISGKLSKNERYVVLFDLDSANIKRYEQKDFEKIFGCFL